MLSAPTRVALAAVRLSFMHYSFDRHIHDVRGRAGQDRPPERPGLPSAPRALNPWMSKRPTIVTHR
jgi:hypothetical protein